MPIQPIHLLQWVLRGSYISSDQMVSAVPTIQIPIHSQDTINSAHALGMGMPLAIAALIQNQVDHILQLRKSHLPRFLDWKHEDHRKPSSFKSRKSRKESLLQQHPGLLSGPQAIDLQGDEWTPIYIISASIPPTHLNCLVRDTDLQVCNVIWQFKTSNQPLALTLYINHVDPTQSPPTQRISTGPMSSHNLSRLLMGQKGVRIVHAAHYLMKALRKEPMPVASTRTGSGTPQAMRMTLRVGHTVGEFHWQTSSEAGHLDRLVLKEEDLTPYSLKNLEARPGFTFPYDTDANRTLSPEKMTRVQAIYWRRFRYQMSEKESGETNVTFTEPTQERALAKADEEVVTIRGLSGTLTPEYLFSGIYTIFPPKREWSISFPSCSPSVVTFFMPDSGDIIGAHCDSPICGTTQEQLLPPAGSFFFRDRLIATSPAGFSRVGVNYIGGLDTSENEFDLQVTGGSFKEFQQHLFRAIDMGIRRLPELAVELAIDILTDASALPDDCGSTPLAGDDMEGTEVKRAYRTAFEVAWRRLNPELADHQGGLYPYVPSLVQAAEEEALIQNLGMHPIPVHPRVRLLLAKCGPYPLVKDHAETLLLSAMGAAHLPAGVEIFKAALSKLLPDADLAADPLSVRQYAHSYPRVVWDPDTRVFVMASSLGARRCAVHKDAAMDVQVEGSDSQAGEKQPTSQCLCWIGIALQAAASSWQVKSGGQRSRPDFDEEFFHVLLECYQTAFPALCTLGQDGRGANRQDRESPSPEEDDDVLSYFGDAMSQLEDTTAQAMGSPRPSGKASAALPTPTVANSARSNSTVPYPSPTSSPPLPRRPVVRRAKAAQGQQSQQSSPQSNAPAIGSGMQRSPESREQGKVPKDMTDLFRMWDKTTQGVAGIAKASKLRMAELQKESAIMREELAEERARRTALEAAFTAYKVDSEAALAAKDTTIAANVEDMKQKDAHIDQLEERVRILMARIQEKDAAMERQTALSRDKTERIRQVEEREIRWARHFKKMLGELPESCARDGSDRGEEQPGRPRKKAKLS